MEHQENAKKTDLFAAKTYGGLEAWSAFMLPHPKFGRVPGKKFLQSELGLTSIEVSLNAIAPGSAVPFLHAHHQNEELYLFLSGKGQMLLDDEVIEVSAGTAVRVAPPVMRSCRNTGTEPLTCVCIQAKAGSLVQSTAEDGFMSSVLPVWPDA